MLTSHILNNMNFTNLLTKFYTDTLYLHAQALPKQTYLCMTNYDEPFSFDCLNGSLPSDGATIYTVCGTPYPVPSEHKTVVIASSLFGLAFFYQLLFKSALPTKLQKVKKA